MGTHVGTHLSFLNESYPMNTTIKRVDTVFINLCVLVLWKKVASIGIGRVNFALKDWRVILWVLMWVLP